MFIITKNTANVTDSEPFHVSEKELPCTVTVWEVDDRSRESRLFACIVIDVGTIRIEGHDGRDLGEWHRTTFESTQW